MFTAFTYIKVGFFDVYIYLEYQNSVGQKKYRKACYSSKIFVNFADFPCVIFWAQNVSIPPDQNFSIPLSQNVLILFVSNIYNGNIQTFWHRELYMKT